LNHLIISNNSTSGFHGYGGGLCFYNCQPIIEDVIIQNNSAWAGGGIYIQPSCFAVLNNATICNNSGYGGGVYVEWSSMNLNNVLIYENSSSNQAAGFMMSAYNSSNTCNLVNITIADNNGQAMKIRGGGQANVINSIIWDNESSIRVEDDSSLLITHSDIQNGEDGISVSGELYWLDNNIDEDPLFADATNIDYQLSEGSPCIDAGTAYFEYEGEVLVDLSEDEYYGNAPDMGVYEYGMVEIDEFKIENVKCKISNYPNPFNPETTISFSTTESTENIEISIYNIKGQRIRSFIIHNSKSKINHVVWDGRNTTGRKVSSGVYLLRLKSNNENATKKIMLMK